MICFRKEEQSVSLASSTETKFFPIWLCIWNITQVTMNHTVLHRSTSITLTLIMKDHININRQQCFQFWSFSLQRKALLLFYKWIHGFSDTLMINLRTTASAVSTYWEVPPLTDRPAWLAFSLALHFLSLFPIRVQQNSSDWSIEDKRFP